VSYDAVIVGSGAGGGVAAWVLASAGWRVLVLERGPWFSSEDFSNDEIKFGERAMIDQDPSVWPRSFRADAALGDRTHSGRILPGSICVGGSTVHYCGVSFRAQPGDFRLRSLYGEIEDAELRDWPLEY
jgi:choline dehydrogenase-like flavoprotein